MSVDEGPDWQRLDKFLFHARFARTRAIAERLIEAGHVRINRQPTVKAHAKLRLGDVLTLRLPAGIRVVRVEMIALRRGPAPEARRLYAEIAEDQPAPAHLAQPHLAQDIERAHIAAHPAEASKSG
jgi:ribosome-associated heat shock protein Hsp15